ncbi:hypothetical protein MAR_001039 [Mya arenaria]|uniref:EGF-like domain-containing protein n=1 Tax=Mya arenaria TaxID=6604 RepID=A0ABY7FE09_MYAAR|nr:hypothetical protein MAR_001039 [Mya arenaria]
MTQICCCCHDDGVVEENDELHAVPQGPTDLGNHNSVYDLWMSDETLNPDTENAMAVLPGITYKSRDVIEWENRSISLVKVAFYRGADEVAFIVFGAAGPTYNHSNDCINKTLCHSPDCWQDPMGNCLCHGYPCVSSCSKLPCPDHTICQPNPTNMSEHTCECLYGIQGDTCQGFARDFVRRSVHRLSGRNSQFSRRHLKEEKSSPDTQARIKNNSSNKTLGKSEQLSPDSSVVFGEANPAFQDDDSPPTPQPTPPIDRRYTEFPTRTVALQSVAPPSVSVTEIQMHEKKQGGSVFSQNKNAQRRYENVPLPPVIDAKMRRESPHVFEASERASTIGSFEKASTMSELSDATSTSGFSDYTGDGPANLPPSEMISKDMIRHHGHHRHKVRSRPRSRASTADQPKPIVAPETVEGQINYAMERSRLSISSMSSLSSEATHKSDSTQRSGEVTKSDILRARYELSHPRESAGRFAHNKGLSYQEIKRQLDADMRRREAREKKMLEEMDEDAKYEEERTKKQKMRQVESLDSGIDAEHNSADRNSDGKIQIIRARSADELNRNRGLTVNYSSKEATV